MKEWNGAAGICINERQEVLMVRAKGSKAWAIPSGGIEEGETPEDCCIRETKEETGYEVRIKEKLMVKEMELKGYHVKTHYYLTVTIGDSTGIADPDQTIVEARWHTLSEVDEIDHAYPEDKKLIMELLKASW